MFWSVGRWRLVVFALRKTHNKELSKKFSKLKLVLHVPAKKFKEIVKINIDPHKILDNFCLINNFSEECLSYHIPHGCPHGLYMTPWDIDCCWVTWSKKIFSGGFAWELSMVLRNVCVQNLSHFYISKYSARSFWNFVCF